MFRAIRDTKDTSRNLFNAEVEQETSGNRNVGTVNLPIPYSMVGEDDLGFDYQNIATGYKTRNNEGTVFAVKDVRGFTSGVSLQKTVSDDEEDEIIGSILQNMVPMKTLTARSLFCPMRPPVFSGDAALILDPRRKIKQGRKDGCTMWPSIPSLLRAALSSSP